MLAKPITWLGGLLLAAFLLEEEEKVKKVFDEAGISIPYPQRDVHLYNEK